MENPQLSELEVEKVVNFMNEINMEEDTKIFFRDGYQLGFNSRNAYVRELEKQVKDHNNTIEILRKQLLRK